MSTPITIVTFLDADDYEFRIALNVGYPVGIPDWALEVAARERFDRGVEAGVNRPNGAVRVGQIERPGVES